MAIYVYSLCLVRSRMCLCGFIFVVVSSIVPFTRLLATNSITGLLVNRICEHINTDCMYLDAQPTDYVWINVHVHVLYQWYQVNYDTFPIPSSTLSLSLSLSLCFVAIHPSPALVVWLLQFVTWLYFL